MRYRLRTLLILVVIAGVLFARIGYLKRMRDYHQQEVASLMPTIANGEGEDADRVATAINELADGDVGTESHTKGVVVGKNKIIFAKERGRIFWNVSPAPLLNTAVGHQIIANRYDRAMYRPWTLVSEKLEP